MNTDITEEQAEELAGMGWKLPAHSPTIAIEAILAGYDADDRIDVWESIQAYADIHARAAMLSAAPTPPSAPVQQSVDAARYQRLRILGCAPMNTPQLDNGTVLRFQSLDEFLDNDLAIFASRGESASPLLDKNDQTEGEVPIGYIDREQLSHWEKLRGTKYARACIGFSTQPFKSELSDYTLPIYTNSQPPQPDSNELVVALAEARRERDKFYGEANIERQNSAELKANSDRYLFLRNQTINEDMCPPIDGLFIGHVPQNVVLTFEHADAAIDAALAQSPSKKGGE